MDRMALRKVLTNMLGMPLNMSLPQTEIAVKKEFLTETDCYTAWRYQLEIMPEFWFYGVLYLPKEQSARNALVIAQHGGDGTPEIVGGLVLDSANYNHMVERVIRKGVVVFAPQLLSWNGELYGSTGYDREFVNKRLVQLGGSITALEIHCIMRCVDFFPSVRRLTRTALV